MGHGKVSRKGANILAVWLLFYLHGPLLGTCRRLTGGPFLISQPLLHFLPHAYQIRTPLKTKGQFLEHPSMTAFRGPQAGRMLGVFIDAYKNRHHLIIKMSFYLSVALIVIPERRGVQTPDQLYKASAPPAQPYLSPGGPRGVGLFPPHSWGHQSP